jgi:hypothetical protein
VTLPFHYLVNLLLEPLILLLHSSFHLLLASGVPSDLCSSLFLHFLEPLKVLNLAHQLGERVIGVLAEEAGPEDFGDIAILLIDHASREDHHTSLVHDVTILVSKISLVVYLAALGVNQLAFSGLLEHRVAEGVHLVVTTNLLKVELQEGEQLRDLTILAKGVALEQHLATF